MSESRFVYESYIRATPDAVWSALTDADVMKQYWFGMHCQSQWTPGAAWTRFDRDGTVVDTGEVFAAEPPRRMIVRWRHQKRPELRAEGESLCTLDLLPVDATVKLSITHTMAREPSKLIAAVSEGWPRVISNLKTLLETGSVLFTEKNP